MTIDTRKDRGVGATFVSSISTDVMESDAVKHPYLRAMRRGDFPNVHMALQDFAFQYGLYSAHFVRYMSAVIDNLSSAEHEAILKANLAEEKGETHDIDLPPDVLDSVVGESHALLYRRFQLALGLGNGSLKATSECPGLLWSQRFLALCAKNECVGVGALGIGTELIVASIYDQILDGLKAHSDLTPCQRVFFDLHSVCDDEHAAQMLLITENLAKDTDACKQLEYGIQNALELRANFWSMMLKRAKRFPAEKSPANQRLSAVGHEKSL